MSARSIDGASPTYGRGATYLITAWEATPNSKAHLNSDFISNPDEDRWHGVVKYPDPEIAYLCYVYSGFHSY